ncbi:MAG TPA: hypothetical protein DCO79_01320 [Spirochaeta sp.]|nr:hypothetical protein [Spirochaeta sp.]
MKKVKLIIGTVNSYSVVNGEEKLKKIYERSYKPFLRTVHKSSVPVTMYYSGELLSWIIDKHDGMQMLVNDIVKSKKIEFLGGGYYSPLFSLIPRKDRVSQIELMTTEIRKRFGRRPRGMWITEKVWEPSMPMTMNNAGMEFTFLDEEFFEDAGLFNGELYRPCMTEDQGKKVVVFPISNRFISQFFLEDPESLLEQIISCGSEKEERFITLLLPGEELDFNDGAGEKIEKFFKLIEENKKHIDVILPGTKVREIGAMRKVYFGCVSPGDIGRWSGPVYRDSISANGSDEGIAVKENKAVNTQSFFRHFLAKYPESNFLYSRMIDVHMLVSQVRGDKQRKKSAETELFKSQNHSAFWHGGGKPGIYSSESRRKAYASLIEAEKFTRERGEFRSTLVKDDFDMDGLDEFIYRSLSLNANIHSKGGVLFELDYLRSAHNYLATMARHHEWYHEDETIDRYTRNAFVDHFLQPDEKIENFFDMSYRENGDFVSGVYRVEKYNKERKIIELIRNGNIITKKNKFGVKVKKSFSFKRNTIVVDYEIENNSDSVLNTVFASEINLSFSARDGKDIKIGLIKNDKKIKIDKEMFSDEKITEILIQDNSRKVNVIFSTELEGQVWGFPIKTRTGTGKVVESLYQSDCFIPLWNISLGPGKVWKNKLQLRLERRVKKNG